MNKTDQLLGMNRDISRRDFLNGVSVAIGASLLPHGASAQNVGVQDMPGYYPPELTGMRGSHAGSFETAHATRNGTTFDGDDTGERYDLVVVGGGISGLAAAHYFRQSAGNNARILILDNHDDFGGHAKRNEFQIDDQTIIGYGGTMFIEAPNTYPTVAKQLFKDLGINTDLYSEYFDKDLYASLGLSQGLFFDKETFGADYLAVGDNDVLSALEGSPLSSKARADLVRLREDKEHYLHDVAADRRVALLQEIDYQTYLRDFADMDEAVLNVMLPAPRSVWAVNSDAFPAYAALNEGYPGFGDLEFAGSDDVEEAEAERDIFHFPDGNASIARLLVRHLIPAVASGDSMEDIVTTRFNYNKLDDSRSPVRLRLNSTVVRAQHIDDDLTKSVRVTYLRDGKAHSVEAGNVVMACYNAIIPHLCPEIPATQKDALSNCIRSPLVYSNVLIRNWTSFAKLGIRRASCPGSYHHRVTLDFPVSMGDYHFSSSPEEPIVLHLTRVPGEPGNPSALEQFNAGKRDLLATSFETFERNIRDQLQRLLSPGGFDAARDIAGITVNRWPHGYAYGHDPETGQIAFNPGSWPAEKRVWEIGRKPFGNIRIAGTDAASNAMTESAIEEAHRAVSEIG